MFKGRVYLINLLYFGASILTFQICLMFETKRLTKSFSYNVENFQPASYNLFCHIFYTNLINNSCQYPSFVSVRMSKFYCLKAIQWLITPYIMTICRSSKSLDNYKPIQVTYLYNKVFDLFMSLMESSHNLKQTY